MSQDSAPIIMIDCPMCHQPLPVLAGLYYACPRCGHAGTAPLSGKLGELVPAPSSDLPSSA